MGQVLHGCAAGQALWDQSKDRREVEGHCCAANGLGRAPGFLVEVAEAKPFA